MLARDADTAELSRGTTRGLSLVLVPVALGLQAVLFESTRRWRKTDARP